MISSLALGGKSIRLPLLMKLVNSTLFASWKGIEVCRKGIEVCWKGIEVCWKGIEI